MPSASKIFVPNRSLGYVSNHIPLQVRYIKSRKENLIVTCTGKAFHTYGISHFGLLSVSKLHSEDITCMSADAYHIYTACKNEMYAWRRGTELKHTYRGHTKPIHFMLPFGPYLISIDTDNYFKVWDIKEETVHLELTFDIVQFQITAIVHPSTYINKILLGSEQGTLQLWNINTSKLIYSFKGWNVGISCLEQAPALDVIAIGLYNGRIMSMSSHGIYARFWSCYNNFIPN
jgi:U3 small nucleolar RNA-associated protein 21